MEARKKKYEYSIDDITATWIVVNLVSCYEKFMAAGGERGAAHDEVGVY